MGRLAPSIPIEFKKLYPRDYSKFPTSEDWQIHYKAEVDALEALEKRAKVWRFPIADGCALYEIVKMRPLTLRWIPYGDAWQAPDYVIRGLREQDIKEYLYRETFWNQMAESAR